MRILPHIARVVAIIAIPTSLATATTTINVSTISNYLDGGNTTAAPDAYRGTTGNGWASGWELPNSLSASLVDVVRESDETEFYDTPYQELTTGSGNYLYVEAGLEADAVGAVSVGRKVGDGRLGIDLTAAYTIEFLFRVDESDLSWNFTTADDRYQLYDYPTLTNGSRTGVGWFISAVGDHPANSLGSVDWVFYDGQGRTGSTGTTYVNTGLALVLNNTYKFEVTVDPAGKSWDGTVTNLATFETHTSTNLGWRIDTTLETGNPDAILSGLMQFCGRGNDSNDKRIFAVDSIQVHQEQSFTIGGMSQVVARFNDGETEEAVDGFVGMAGNGWNSAWSTRNDRATLAAAVSSANELKSGGGNCLEMTVTVGNTFTYGYGAGGVTRDYARVNETGIDWTQDHTIQFTVRIDEDMDAFSTSFTDVNDKYQIFDQAYARGGISGDTIWGAFANGDALGSSYWTFLDGSDVRTTGIALTQYGVYDFTIDINAAERTYDVTLVSGLDSFTAEDLDWRNPGIDYVGGFLNFMARGNETGEVRAWSIDDIVITAASSIPTDIPGDANNDGRVDADDAKALADNWGKSGDAAWADGDFNGDLKVDAKDAAILAANWGYVWSPAAPAAEGSIAGVPEPGAAALLLTMAAGLALGFDRRW